MYKVLVSEFIRVNKGCIKINKTRKFLKINLAINSIHCYLKL